MIEVKGRHFLRQAAKLGALTLASSVLGFAREFLIARNFGASHITDSYLVAVSVPMLIFAFLFGSALRVSVVPTLAVQLQENPSYGRSMFAQFLSGAALASLVAVSLIFIFPGVFVESFAPGLSHSILALDSMRSLSPLLFFLVVSYALASFHCASGHAAHWGLILVAQNLTLVVVLIVSGARWGISGLVVGTLAGALLAFLIQARIARKDGFNEAWTDPFRAGAGRDILVGMGAFALAAGLGGDYGAAQIDIFLIRFFASRMPPGSITLLALGNKLMEFPVLVVGAALGMALLPSVSIAIAADDRSRAGEQLSHALAYALLLVSPIAVIYFDLAPTIVNTVFRHTAIMHNQLDELSRILQHYAGAVVGMVLMMILNMYLGALRRIRALIAIGLLAVTVDAALMWTLSHIYGASGIATAITIGTFVYSLMLSLVLIPELPSAAAVGIVKRSGLIAPGAIAMHLLLLAGVRFHAFGSTPWLGNIALPLLAGITSYAGWVGLHRKRLYLGLRAA